MTDDPIPTLLSLPEGKPSPVAVLTSLWPTGAQSLARQLAERGYHRATGTDSALMPPAIAEHAIATLTRPADVVLDPDCGAATTLVEALRAGRHAIGLTAQRRWWSLARTNITAARAQAAPVKGMVLLDRRPGTLAVDQTAGLTGRVALLLTTLRPTHPVTDPASGVDRLCELLMRCRPLLRPGGHVVITTWPWRHPARLDLLDLPGQILTAGTAAGLTPIARCHALTAKLRGPRVFLRATRAQRRTATRIERTTGRPSALPAHHSVLVFRADPIAVEAVLAAPIPPLPASSATPTVPPPTATWPCVAHDATQSDNGDLLVMARRAPVPRRDHRPAHRPLGALRTVEQPRPGRHHSAA